MWGGFGIAWGVGAAVAARRDVMAAFWQRRSGRRQREQHRSGQRRLTTTQTGGKELPETSNHQNADLRKGVTGNGESSERRPEERSRSVYWSLVIGDELRYAEPSPMSTREVVATIAGAITIAMKAKAIKRSCTSYLRALLSRAFSVAPGVKLPLAL